jgi:alpha-L-rhamnosidase
MRKMIIQDPYLELNKGRTWPHRGVWPCKWVACPDAGEPPFAAAYRTRFSLDKDSTIRVHVSADERYELFLDGLRVGRGSERGDRENWFFETYELKIEKGDHLFVARVWSMGEVAPYAQMTVRPGFLFAPEEPFIPLLATGLAKWEAKKLEGISFIDPSPAWGTGANLEIDAASFSWGFERGEGSGWQPAKVLHDGRDAEICNEVPPVHFLKPAMLPAMMEKEVETGLVRFVAAAESPDTKSVVVNDIDNRKDEIANWDLIKGKKSITINPKTTRRIIIDLENYYCAYPELVTSGGKGSLVRILWAESLFETYENYGIKGNRNEIEGKMFWGVGDTFKPDGGQNRKFETLWWQAGRYLELFVSTADEPLTIDSFRLRETRYPLEMRSRIETSDKRINAIVPIALRGLQMCSHETYMDCPYYEQLMYVGDTRLEVLSTYMITNDDRLPRKALKMFDFSRVNWGLTDSRYPSRVRQIIPPFSLWWIGMVYDFGLWRQDKKFVQELMPGVHQVLDRYLSYMNKDGLIQAPNGWMFMDWALSWDDGMPPEGEFGVNSLVNWQTVYTLNLAAELEEWLGEPELAKRNRKIAADLVKRIDKVFWDKKRNLYADDPSKKYFSEHSQCLAILSGSLNATQCKKIGQALVTEKNLTLATIYFMHYLFEAYQKIGRIDTLLDRMGLWFELDRLGLKTTTERPEPSRSDCHAWGAHPLYHLFASILGIRPGKLGSQHITLQPQLGRLDKIKGSLVHPLGTIKADLRFEKGKLKGSVTLPKGVTGKFIFNGKTKNLKCGTQTL